MSSNDCYQLNQPYHIYNRGSRRQRIFFEEENYDHLTKLLSNGKANYQVRILAYALMPNHYHLLISQGAPGAITGFLRTVFQRYVQAIVRQRDHSGRLFQGPPKRAPVHADYHALHLCRYIHVNPVEAQLVDMPQQWEYSNYREFVHLRRSILWDPHFVHTYFRTPESYREFVLSARRQNNPHRAIKRYLIDE